MSWAKSSPIRRYWVGLFLLTVVLAAGLYFWKGPGRRTGGEQRQTSEEVYYCPMHPSYKSDKPDNCPVCSMKLVKMEPAGAAQSQQADQAETYYCPMHPGYKSDKSGSCPVCNMDLIKLEESASTHDHDSSPSTPSGPASPKTIFVPPQRQQLIGVRSTVAEVMPLIKEIRTVGKVAYDETKISHIHTKVTGYIESVFVDFVGQVVKQGDPLFNIYSPDLVSTQEEYLLALRSRDLLKDSSFNWISTGSQSLLDATRQRLRLWDISEHEIERLEVEGKARRELTIYSPVNGLVTHRAAFHHGRFVSPEMDLYTLVDLSSVWLVGEIYEYELPWVKTGQAVEIEFPYASESRPLRGKITYLYPYLDPKTRTAQVRMEFPNPDLALKPDMFFNIRIKVNLGRQVAVPEDAVLNTGTQQYVFVDMGEGYFEPRAIKVGAEATGYYAIQEGLKAGERVVTAANFILDSESRLKGVLAGMGSPESAPTFGPGTPSSNLQIDILEPRVARVGMNPIRLQVKEASGRPITDAEVDVTLFMPSMGSMAPMISSATLQPAGQGEYKGRIDFPMAFTWQTTVTVKREGKPMGSVHTSITAR